MAPAKRGIGPTIKDIKDYNNRAEQVFDRARVSAFLKATKDVSPNKHGQPRTRGKKRFVQRDAGFACDLRKMKCCAKRKKGGGACTRNVVRGLFLCWQHTKSIYRVRMDKSGFPNTNMNGLFACTTIPAKTIIIPYFGEQLTRAQLASRYGRDNTAPYGVDVRGTGDIKVIDSACFQGMAGLANRGRQNPIAIRNNAQLKDTSSLFPRLVSTRKIEAGKEIFASYGRGGYRFSDSGFEPGEKIYRRRGKC